MQMTSLVTKIHFCTPVISTNFLPPSWVSGLLNGLGLSIGIPSEFRALERGEFQRIVERFGEMADIQRADEVKEESGLERLDRGFGPGVAAEGEDRRGLRQWVGAQELEEARRVDGGEIEVDEHHLRP